MTNELLVNVETLRRQVQDKYREVALDPHGTITSTPVERSPPASATTRPPSMPYPTVPSNRSPG